MKRFTIISCVLFSIASSCSSVRFHIPLITSNLSDYVIDDGKLDEATITFNVADYGAHGDGKNDDSQAFLKAWGDLCGYGSNKGIPTLNIPQEKTFMLNPITFKGPCKSNTIHVQIQGTLVAPKSKAAWKGNVDNWLQFQYVNGLIINGGGRIDGQGDIWWKVCNTKDACDEGNRPTALAFHSCNGLQLSGLIHLNSPRNHISINECNGATISDLHIIAPEDSPNTDGIDISGSTHINIQNSLIQTGDDCIAMNAGSSNINISGIACGPGHGISVGSLGRNGGNDMVEEVHVRNCSFKGTTNGVRIKTWQGGSGYARKITFEDITFQASENPIIITQHYSALASDNIMGSDVDISDVTYRNMYGSSATEKAIILDCSVNKGCTNIVMEHIGITPSVPGMKISSVCNNAKGRSHVATPAVSCLL